MSVDLTPAELGFKRPFTNEVSQVLRLRNPNTDPVAFKVKTTAPKQYCVRPNSGRIEPGHDVEVQVLLQAMKEDPPADTRCRDKFLVQSVAIAAGQDGSNITQVWTNIEQTAKSSIQEKKIRVSWLPAENGIAAAPVTTNGVAHTEDELPVPSSPSPPAVTPQRQTSAAPVTPSVTAQTQAAVNSATTAIASATGISEADLRRQLDEAKATITRLQQQTVEQTGLRQRKTGEDTVQVQKTHPASIQAAPPAGGVPVQIVAALCALAFLIAYLFF